MDWRWIDCAGHDSRRLGEILPASRNASLRVTERMFMDKLRIEFEPFIDDGDRQSIVNSLDGYNMAVTSLPEWHPVNFVLRGERGEVRGGLLGYVWGGWLQVTYLWVSEAARGSGYGSLLLSEAENYARSRGASGSALETHSFQARPFYESHGYEVFGSLDGYPLGHAKHFLRKALT